MFHQQIAEQYLAQNVDFLQTGQLVSLLLAMCVLNDINI